MAASQLRVIREEQLEAEGEHCQLPVGKMPKLTKKEAEAKMAVRVESRTGISFPVELQDGRGCEEEEDNGDGDQLLHLRYWRETCSVSGKLGSQPKKQEFCAGMYADNAELKDLVRSKFKEDSKKPMQEVIDSDVAVMVRLVIVFAALNMWRVRKIIDQGIGVSLKKLSGGENNEELAKKYIELLLLHCRILGDEEDNMTMPPGSVIEISRLPGYVLETRVRDELVSKVESELLCRAYINMYLILTCTWERMHLTSMQKERFGRTLLSLR